jgi:hypothetical protein
MNLFEMSEISPSKSIERLLTEPGYSGYREIIRKLWIKFEPYAHNEFRKDFLSDDQKFKSLLWEMILANKLLDNGYDLQVNLSKDAPDLCVLFNGKKIWIECVYATQGDDLNPDRVPDIIFDDTTHQVETEKSILRCTQVLESKSKQYKNWINKRLCKPNDILIVAVNGHELQLHISNNGLPDIMGALYEKGEQVYVFSQDDFKKGQSIYLRRTNIVKHNKTLIPTNYFLSPNNQHIDGIIYSDDWLQSRSSCPRYCFVQNINKIEKLQDVSFSQGFQTFDFNEAEGRLSLQVNSSI